MSRASWTPTKWAFLGLGRTAPEIPLNSLALIAPRLSANAENCREIPIAFGFVDENRFEQAGRRDRLGTGFHGGDSKEQHDAEKQQPHKPAGGISGIKTRRAGGRSTGLGGANSVG